jgi:hypothetical protein
MKVFIKGMQAFVGIRLFNIPWPSAVMQLFDITRFFSFSIDVVRPECTFSYDEDTKLASIIIGPFVCVLFVGLFMLTYISFKCRRICQALEHPTIQPLLAWNFSRTFKSVWSCIMVSALSLTFSAERMMRHGLLWNALNPSLVNRSDTIVLNQKVRRSAVLGGTSSSKKTNNELPQDWISLRTAVSNFDFVEDFNETTKRFRMMLSSAMSIFVFTFPGSMESALSTFDCIGGVMRKAPTVQCNTDDRMYLKLLIISSIGILIYCVVMPCCIVLVLRSRWSREAYIHGNMAYNQLVGFLTSLYRRKCYLWELIIFLQRVVLIFIPIFVSQNNVVQSLSTFIVVLLYMFLVLHVKPMQSNYLFKVEMLSCVGVLVGAFTSVFFVVEFEGSLLLSGQAKEYVGLVFVIICATAFAFSAKCIYDDFSRLLIMYKISFTNSWILDINSNIGAGATEGFYIPLVLTLVNKVASAEIFKMKLKMRTDLLNYAVKHPLGRLGKWFFHLQLWYRAQQYLPSRDHLEKCMKEPELETLVYLHKLSERVSTWESVSWKFWGVPKDDLPAEFREVKGEMDPPHAEYEHQANVIHMLEDALPPSARRVLMGLLFSNLMVDTRTNQTAENKQ